MKGVHEFDLGPWPARVFLISEKPVYRRWVRYWMKGDAAPFPEKDGGFCSLMTSPDHPTAIFIVVGPSSSRDELAVTLAHEAVHARRFLFEHVGEDAPSKEAEAYLVEHIVSECLRALSR